MAGPAFLCETCSGQPLWRITRRGDAAVTWACDEHLSAIGLDLQRDWEITELVLQHSPKMREWAEVGETLSAIEEA